MLICHVIYFAKTHCSVATLTDRDSNATLWSGAEMC